VELRAAPSAGAASTAEAAAKTIAPNAVHRRKSEDDRPDRQRRRVDRPPVTPAALRLGQELDGPRALGGVNRPFSTDARRSHVPTSAARGVVASIDHPARIDASGSPALSAIVEAVYATLDAVLARKNAAELAAHAS
jgi:hypothetical protein